MNTFFTLPIDQEKANLPKKKCLSKESFIEIAENKNIRLIRISYKQYNNLDVIINEIK